MKTKYFFVYILTNTYNTVFYTGMSNNLLIRTFVHKHKMINSFTKKYNIWKLIYFEIFEDVNDAIIREKQIKDYRREKKIALIKKINPKFSDLLKKLK